MANRDNAKLLNYSTEIEPLKTAGEIMGLLVTKGAQSIMIDYKDGEPVALAFKVAVNGQDVAFRLPCNVEGAERAMRRMSIPPRYQNRDQAKRTAWRIVKTWVEAQMALIDCGQAEMAEVFLPYAITATGQTLFQRIQQNPNRLLGAGGNAETESNVVAGRFAAGGE